MLSLVYVSTTVEPLSDDDLAGILRHARARNTELGITGVLAYRAGRCIQVLEGPDDVVQDRFAVISRDPRHTEVRLLCADPLEERAFPDWSMAFQPLDPGVTSLPGYSDLFTPRRGPDADRHASRGRALVDWFRRHPVAG